MTTLRRTARRMDVEEIHGRIREYVSVSRSTLTMTVGESCVELG